MHLTFSVATLSVVSGLKIGIRRLSEICFVLGRLNKGAICVFPKDYFIFFILFSHYFCQCLSYVYL